jgi:amino acid adenylation domain-containing protein
MPAQSISYASLYLIYILFCKLNQSNMKSADVIVADLTSIWRSLFNREEISEGDDFFELGGDSLLALRLITSIDKEFNVRLSFRAIFSNTTLQRLATYLREQIYSPDLPPIGVQDRPAHIPLSFSQERLWFIDQYQGSVHYHIPMAFRLKGIPDLEALERSFQYIVRRHEILRTVLRDEDGTPYQEVMDPDWRMERSDVTRDKPLSFAPDDLTGHIIARPFDLGRDSPLRVQLTRISAQEHLLIMVLHHIAADGRSVEILFRELSMYYEAFIQRRSAGATPFPVQYADFALWQRRYLQGSAINHRLSYWKNRLSGLSPLTLQTDFPRPAIQGTRGAHLSVGLDASLVADLQVLSLDRGCTLFMTLLAVFNVLLSRYSGHEDICVGSPVSGRNRQELEGLIGFFVNTLALRCDLSGNPRFTDLLEQVKNTCLEAYEYQDTPFERMVEALVSERDLSRHPLFQVMFSLESAPLNALRLGGLQISRQAVKPAGSKVDLAFSLQKKGDQLSCHVTWSTDLFKESTIIRMVDHYVMLLRSAVAAPLTCIGELPMLQTRETRQLLETFNDTTVAYPRNSTIPDLLAAQASDTPDRTAVVFEDRRLTYRELNDRSNRLGNYLRSKGLREEHLVAVSLDRSMEMIVAILGILKAGAAYLPIDPQYPAERINYMLRDSRAGILITSGSCAPLLHPLAGGIELIRLDEEWHEIERYPADEVVNALGPQHTAYVIYTSGTTGKPKGVVNEHRGIVNRLRWAQDYFGLNAGDAILQKTTFCFDVSVWELLWPLCAGARLVFAKPDGHKDVAYLKRLISLENITTLHFVPSMLPVFLEETAPGECAGLRRVLCSGEALQSSHIDLFYERLPGVGLYNLYGPTEAAIDVSCWSVPGAGRREIVPIGKPVANTRLYVLDAGGHLLPMGMTGELCIGGIQVAREYLHQPEITAEKFIPDPFDDTPGARIYRTGDLARWLPDGNLQYLGRKDDQVKIRGYRVELGEIEHALLQSRLVRQGIVLAMPDDGGGRKLIGYVTPAEGFSREEIHACLSRQLPEFMVPSLWVVLDKLPLSANGKIDKKALPAPDSGFFEPAGFVAPGDETEIDLAAIWKELLNVGRIGIQDNFFSLGGHSLLAMRLVSAISKKMNADIPVKMVFQLATISLMAKFIRINRNNSLPEIEFCEATRL